MCEVQVQSASHMYGWRSNADRSGRLVSKRKKIKCNSKSQSERERITNQRTNELDTHSGCEIGWQTHTFTDTVLIELIRISITIVQCAMRFKLSSVSADQMRISTLWIFCLISNYDIFFVYVCCSVHWMDIFESFAIEN